MYNKLFSSIVHSSVWSEDSDTCKVWVTLLALKDQKGFVFASVPGVARLCGLSIETTSEAISKFESPDPYSSDLERNPEAEGRKIRRSDGGWFVINSDYYNDLASAEERREKDREYQKNKRAAARQSATVGKRRKSSQNVGPQR